MTVPPIPNLVIDHDESWIRVNLTDDVAVWADRAAGELTARDGLGAWPTTAALSQALLAAAVTASHPDDSTLIFLLMPRPERRLAATARFVYVAMDAADDVEGRHQLTAGLLTPGNGRSTELPTPVGDAVRLTRRDGSTSTISVAWSFASRGWGVVLTAGFGDALDAGRYGGAITTLARGVRWPDDVI